MVCAILNLSVLARVVMVIIFALVMGRDGVVHDIILVASQVNARISIDSKLVFRRIFPMNWEYPFAVVHSERIRPYPSDALTSRL